MNFNVNKHHNSDICAKYVVICEGELRLCGGV